MPKKVCLLESGKIFLAGLVPLLVRKLAKLGMSVEIQEEGCQELPVNRPVSSRMLSGIHLDPDQVRAIEACLAKRRGYIKAVTGFGKTEVLLGVYEALRPVRALMVVTRRGLRQQAIERAGKRLAGPVVYLRRGEPLPDKGLVITTYHTLHRLLFGATSRASRTAADPRVRDWCAGVGLGLFDECHRLPGEQFSRCVKAIPASYRIGASATPLVNNALRNMILRGCLGEKIIEAGVAQEVEKGRVAQVHVFFREIGQGDRIEFPEVLNYQEAYTKSLSTYEPFLTDIVEVCRWFRDQGMPCLVMVDWVQHGQDLYDRLRKALKGGVDYIHGELSVAEYTRAKQGFLDGRVQTLVASPVLGEGEDLPNVAGLVLACAGRARHALIQKIGRGMRPKEGSNILMVVHYINYRHPYFIKQALANLKSYAASPSYILHGMAPLEVVDDGQ